MCKHILFDLEHGFVHKANDARHISIINKTFTQCYDGT